MLSDIVQQLRFKSFYNLTKELISQVENFVSTIKISNCRSLSDAKKFIISIEKRLTNKMNDEYRLAAPNEISKKLEYSFSKTLDSIREILKLFEDYQSQLEEGIRTRVTRWSSPSPRAPLEHKNIETKPSINFNPQHIKFEDDQSSDASNSSLGDDALMEVAKNAYEQRSHR